MIVTLIKVLAIVLMAVGMFMLFGLTPVRITQDMMDLIRPKDKLRTVAGDMQTRRRRGGLYGELQRIRNTMEATGRGKLFPMMITGIVVFAFAGFVLGIALDNYWLIPSLVVFFGAIPFLYMGSAVTFYENSVRQELETALSIITNSYIRTNNIVASVEENLMAIKPPLRGVFEKFVDDSKVFLSRKECIIRMRDRLDDAVFFEWCTTLLQCQDDHTLKENLNPVVNKLSDIRLANAQVASVVSGAKAEYFAMVGFVVIGVPVVSAMSPGLLEILIDHPVGKFLVGLAAAVVLATFFRMRKVTKTVDFQTK